VADYLPNSLSEDFISLRRDVTDFLHHFEKAKREVSKSYL
jgi:hypothetical protein